MEYIPEEIKPQTSYAKFPAELWEMILDTMDDSQDIQSVLGAFPELSNLFHGKKANWYFDRVFPHIFKQFKGFGCTSNFKCLLALRTVSKSWCNIIEDFLKTHPSRHPYNHNGISRRKISYGQFNYNEENTQLLCLDGTDRIEECYSEMLNHPRNPLILGRLVISNLMLDIPHEPFLEASLVFLKRYGHFVSSFEFLVDIPEDQELEVEEVEGILRKVFECISCTTNVTFLKIHLLFEDDDIYGITRNICFSEFASRIPQLPNLETLIIEDLNHNLFMCISNSFSSASCITNRLKRFEAPLDTLVFPRRFPNICELSLDISFEFELDFDRLTFLNKENCPLLRKLTFVGNSTVRVCINKLFSLLARLEIEEMVFIENCKIITDDQNCNLVPIPGIKYFRVGDGLEHDFEFLKMFTSLEHLHLHFHDSPEVTKEKIEELRSFCKREGGFSSQLRMYMYEKVVPEAVNIWEALPTVKILTVETLTSYWQYSRECGNKVFRIN